MKVVVVTIIGWICSGLIAGCASQESAQKQRGEQRSGEEDVIRQGTGTGTGTGTGVGGTQKPACLNQAATPGTGLALFAQGEFKIEGGKTSLLVDRTRKTKTLCQALIDSGKKAAIFQFVGADCVSCRDESVKLRQMIAASPVGNDLVHIVVFTDLFSDYPQEPFDRFIAQYAPGAPRYYDESALWKTLSANPALPDRATILAMNLNMDAHVYNVSGQQFNIVAAAEALARR